MAFKIESEVKGGETVYRFSGDMDEDANLPALSLPLGGRIAFDFAEVKSINSCGVREWVQWLKKIPAAAQIAYLNCPKVIVDQINTIGGFMRPGTEVRSIFVPYYCEKCEVLTTVLFNKEHLVGGAPVPSVKCKRCQVPAELNVFPSTYFKFLKMK